MILILSIQAIIKLVSSLERGKIKISLDNGGMRILSEVCYVPELRKNLISMGTLQENGHSFRSDGDRDIMRVNLLFIKFCNILY